LTSKELNKIHKKERLGIEKYNKNNELMKCIEYNSHSNIIVEFQDDLKGLVKATWRQFELGSIKNPNEYIIRLNTWKENNKGEMMRVIEYNNNMDVTVEFQDKYKSHVHTNWGAFIKGKVRNPMRKSVFNVGIVGDMYPAYMNYKKEKEYTIWTGMLERCFSNKFKEKQPTYQDVMCCEEWLYYPNFYEWLHAQENFEKLLNGLDSDKGSWALDKDILVKGNKIYSSETCCIVPHKINALFVKNNANRGNFPIGVYYKKEMDKYEAKVSKFDKNQRNYYMSIGTYPTPEDAFYLGYKPYKEKYIQQIAQEEFNKGNITKKCYDAMMKYEVEITD